MFVIQKNPPSANVPRNIRFTEELFDELNKAAVENDVSFNSLVLQCCRYALDELANKAATGNERA
jgi:predicted HicB family RNase H-like nuclease